MKTVLGAVSLLWLGCSGGGVGTVHGKLALVPEVVEISFVPEEELRPFLERRELLRAQLLQLSAQRLEAELECRRATDDSLLRRLELVRSPPALHVLETQKQKLSARSEAAYTHRRALAELTEAARREALRPPPPAALTVGANRAGHFEAELPAGRYGVAVKSVRADGRSHTAIGWTEVGEGGSVELDEATLAEEQ